MTYDRPPALVPATPEYILEVYRDQYRQSLGFDPAVEPDVELTFETTVAEWQNACDLLPWRGLGCALDESWKLGRTDEEWRAVLTPERKRTLRDVCEFIAEGAMRPVVEPLNILGGSCLPAGAFLAIRSMLREAGADADSIRPSTPLAEYARLHYGVFLGPISRLSPHALPPARVGSSRPSNAVWLVGLSGMVVLLLGMLLYCTQTPLAPYVILGGSVLVGLAIAGHWISLGLLPPSSVEFEGLTTFRDLALVMAEGAEGRVVGG